MGTSPILQDATLSVHLAQMLSMSAPAGGAAAGDADDAAPIHLGLLECEEERSKLQHKLIYDALCNLETADALAAFVTHCNTALVQSDDICKLLGIPFRCESNLHSFMCFLLYIHQRSVTDIMLIDFIWKIISTFVNPQVSTSFGSIQGSPLPYQALFCYCVYPNQCSSSS